LADGQAIRRPRADAERNRLRLMAAASAVFTECGADAPLEDIAARAGVGIGTLYRHFPTRQALLAEVYRHANQQLAEAAEQLSSERSPLEALRAWMLLFVDYIATKQVVAPALSASNATPAQASGPTVTTAIADLTGRAEAAGEIILNVDPTDLLRAVMSVANVKNGPGWQASAQRLIDILIEGMRVKT
jgi:AcrR family transcriptional regulator